MASDPMESLSKALDQVNKMPKLSVAVDDVDHIIQLLTKAKEEVLRGWFLARPCGL